MATGLIGQAADQGWIAAVLSAPVGRPTQPPVSGPGAIGHERLKAKGGYGTP
jgi:hypothetical protein